MDQALKKREKSKNLKKRKVFKHSRLILKKKKMKLLQEVKHQVQKSNIKILPKKVIKMIRETGEKKKMTMMVKVKRMMKIIWKKSMKEKKSKKVLILVRKTMYPDYKNKKKITKLEVCMLISLALLLIFLTIQARIIGWVILELTEIAS